MREPFNIIVTTFSQRATNVAKGLPGYKAARIVYYLQFQISQKARLVTFILDLRDYVSKTFYVICGGSS